MSDAHPGRRLAPAAAGVLLGAADTYVVVIVLPAIMAAVGLDLAHLDQATPIVSSFLLGYVVVLPLVGRLSDLHGRTPLLLTGLVLFALGSLVTASATGLGGVVTGRALQGLGGGALVPVTLALVADLWPAQRRGPPLGVVGAVQEVGSVVGPLYGAALGGAAGWRAIFNVNAAIAAAIAVVAAAAGRGRSRSAARRDLPGWTLALLLAVTVVLAISAPAALTDSVSLGTLYTPLVGTVSLTAPIALLAVGLGLALAVREVMVPADVNALLPLRRARMLVRDVDWLGAALAAAVLAIVVLVFAAADPSREVLAPAAPALLPAATLLAAAFVAVELRTPRPLFDLRALRSRPAAGSLLANLAVGAALMAALVDVPVLARVTVAADSQVDAALVLARLLVAVPVGAIAGGLLVRRLGHGVVAGSGMLLSALMFLLMTRWTGASLTDALAVPWLHPADPVLVACGLGFGLAIVPATAAILGAVPPAQHGVAAALTVAARMVGMLAGLGALTAIGLHHFFEVQATLPRAASLCPATPLACPAYERLISAAVLEELHLIFAGAAVAALVAAVVAVSLLRRPRPRPPATPSVATAR